MVPMKNFTVGEIFRLVNPKGKLTSKQLIDGNDVPYVAAKKTNNGVARMCSHQNIPNDQMMPGNCIVFIQQGDGSAGYATYQPKDFYAISCVCCGYIDGILNEEIGMYLVSVLDKNKAFYSHSNSWSGDKLVNTKMPLPVTADGTPDWDYMQEYIAELEQERIAELEQYLIAADLNDYTLTDEDLKILSSIGSREGGERAGEAGVQKEMREFRIGSLFDKVKSEFYGKPNSYVGRKAYTTTKPDEMHTIPLTCAKMGDNGIMYYGETGMFSVEPNCLTMIRDGAVSTGLVYAQDQPTGVLSHSYLMKCKADVAFETLLYCASVMTNALYPLYTRDNPSLWEKKVENDVISLPIQTDPSNHPIIDPAHTYHPDGFIPDWDYMAAYIRAIEKLVIKDVVDFKNEFIAKARSVVN